LILVEFYLSFFITLTTFFMKRSLITFHIYSKPILSALTLVAFSIGSLFLNSCATGGSGAGDTGYGPFDSSGNYVEAWADDPSKWRRNSTINSSMASNDTPPRDATPLPTAAASKSEFAQVRPMTTASTLPKSRSTTSTARTAPKPTAKPAVARSTPRPTVKPKPVVVKPKLTPSTRVVVKKGDTLYGLAIRYKSSVSAIQRANGIRGTILQIGKSLVIPRK
jgi:LysM repeat protein